MQYRTINNAIITLGHTDDSTKGRHFKSRFLQPGLAGYPGQYGNALIKKESLDRFIHTLRNKPVIINHKDNISDDDKVGEVLNVWYNPADGWYWCDGIIYDKTAINLIENRGWSVSSSYNFTKYNDEGGSENNVPYDIEFLDGEFDHLAIVENPRYERANIVFNAKKSEDNITDWITVKGNHIPIKEGETPKEAAKKFIQQKDKNSYLSKNNTVDEDKINEFIEKNNIKTYSQFKEKLNAVSDKKTKSAMDDFAKNNIFYDKKTGKSVAEIQAEIKQQKKEREELEKKSIEAQEKTKQIAELDQKLAETEQNIKRLKEKEKELEEKRKNIAEKYKTYNELEKDFKDYIEQEPSNYQISDIESTAKDLGITKDKPLKIKTPAGNEDITIETIEHLYTREDKTRPKSINKMLATLKNPLIINENNGKRYYFKIFSSENKSKKDIAVVSPEGNVFTNFPADRSNWFFKMLKQTGKTIYSILDDKNKRRKSDNSVAHVNNTIPHFKEGLNPNIKKHEEIVNNALIQAIAQEIINQYK